MDKFELRKYEFKVDKKRSDSKALIRLSNNSAKIDGEKKGKAKKTIKTSFNNTKPTRVISMNSTELQKLEFALDRERNEYRAVIKRAENGSKIGDREMQEAQIGYANTTQELRRVQRSLYGWRFVAETYGGAKNFAADDIAVLRARILELETQEAKHQKVLDNYDKDRGAAKAKLENLREQAGTDTGYMPTEKEIQKAQDELLAIIRHAEVAEVTLPEIRRQLDDLRKELAKLERKTDKVFSDHSNGVYATPGDEIDSLTKRYAARHGVSYAQALHAVIEADPDLAEMYMRQDELVT